jgi:arsenate reductase-like glutaredoxin family protein
MANPDYIVCIPSYKRAELCNEKTLAMLKENSIDPKKINIYVANSEEEEIYKKTLNHSLYNHLIVGVKGLAEQRQFISEQYKEGKPIVFFDDDVASIDLNMSPIFKGKTLDFFFRYAFQECKKKRAFIWGIYPVFNPFFRKGRPEISDNLTYIVGASYGIINRPHLKSIQLTITSENSYKEDVERSIKYFIEDGTVLRFNRIGFVTKYYGVEGGLGNFNERIKTSLIACKRLKKAYPEYGDIVFRKTGMSEFRLKKIPSRFTQKVIKKSKSNKTQKLKKSKPPSL